METPYLNDKINELEIHLRNDELSTLGKEHLTEFKNIKEQLTLTDVGSMCCELLAEHKCKFYVNADWSYLKCDCGKRIKPSEE